MAGFTCCTLKVHEGNADRGSVVGQFDSLDHSLLGDGVDDLDTRSPSSLLFRVAEFCRGKGVFVVVVGIGSHVIISAILFNAGLRDEISSHIGTDGVIVALNNIKSALFVVSDEFTWSVLQGYRFAGRIVMQIFNREDAVCLSIVANESIRKVGEQIYCQ